MGFTIRRIIVFSKNVPRLAQFYHEVFGLKVKGDPTDKDWIELASGECSLALHRGTPPSTSKGVPKIVFWSGDVAKTREDLARKGALLGKVKIFGELHLCDGKDPDGNLFQLSNRS